RDDLAGYLVERLAVAQTGPHPVVEAPHPFVTDGVAIDAQQVAPLQRPEVDEFWPIEDLVDRFLALARAPVGEEGLDIFRRRQRADGVEVDAAEELLVRAQRRRRQA